MQIDLPYDSNRTDRPYAIPLAPSLRHESDTVLTQHLRVRNSTHATYVKGDG